jgi:hypothetical protein
MEPERDIEKLLRAYAKKRRAQAGDPLKPHPATRRRLQAEIARHTPKPDEEEASLSLWELFRQRWAFLLGFALIVFFVATMFFPALSKAKYKAQTAAAKYNLMEIGTAVRMYAEDNHKRLPASLEELTNELQLDLTHTILTDPQNGRRFVYVGAGRSLDGLPSNSLLAYSANDKKGRAVLYADGRVEVVSKAQFSELTNRGASELVALNDSIPPQFAVTPEAGGRRVAAAAPSSGELKSEASLDKAKSADFETAASSFEKMAAKAPAASTGSSPEVQNLFKNTVATARAVPVLANFQVRQNGSDIRIVDADGSVYDGSFLPQSAVAQNEPAPAEMPAAAPPPQNPGKDLNGVEPALPAMQNYLFRVTGTNQTLKQNVVFTGSWLAISNPATNLPPDRSNLGGVAGQRQSMPANQWRWSGSRIAGTAVIGDTNHLEVNAVPLSP